MAKNYILGLDVGSGSVKAVVALEDSKGKIHIGSLKTVPSRGLRRGVIVDMEEVVKILTTFFQEIKEEFGKGPIKNIPLAVGGTNIKTQISRGTVAVSSDNSEIYKDDIERVKRASEAVTLPSNREILHAVTREFIVDGVGDIYDPLGMVGTRLEVVSYIIDSFQPSIKNLMKCVELASGSISSLIFLPLASAAAVLTRNQKELGVLL